MLGTLGNDTACPMPAYAGPVTQTSEAMTLIADKTNFLIRTFLGLYITMKLLIGEVSFK